MRRRWERPAKGRLTATEQEQLRGDLGLAPTAALAQPVVVQQGAAGTSIVGSTGSTDNRLLRADGAGGKTVQASAVAVDDSGNITGAASLDVSANLKVAGTSVVGVQGAAVADATGAGDVVAQLNALLARLRAHGLIAT